MIIIINKKKDDLKIKIKFNNECSKLFYFILIDLNKVFFFK